MGKDLETLIEKAKPIENNALFEKTMSLNEIADILGYEEDTLRKKCAELGFTKNGLKTRLNEEQVTTLKNALVPRTSALKCLGQNALTELEENNMIANALAILQRRNTELQEQNKKLESAANFAYQLCSSKDTIDIGECAKVLNKNIGRNSLFEFLRNKGVLQNNNIPYQKYIDAGYFRVIETKYVTPNGETKISLKTVVFQKGVAYINKLLHKEEA